MVAVLLAALMATQEVLAWKEGPPLPDREGYGGSFAGVHAGTLIVAGGSNFPDKRPWEGGVKRWSDRVTALSDGAWKETGALPHALAYGASVETPEGVLCVGGASADRHVPLVSLLRWERGAVTLRPMPDLPRPLAYSCAARVGSVVYVAGGRETPDSAPLRTFLSLDLSDANPRWRDLEPWPGPERFLSVAGSCDGSFFLFSGARLADGKREYLRDAYRYTPGQGWRRRADLPRPAVAAPSPASALGPGHLLVIGGDDGSQVGFTPPDQHPGFPRDILAYHPLTDAWSVRGEAPFSLVTTAAAASGSTLIVPGGEARPGVRSPRVWFAEPRPPSRSFGFWNYATLAFYPLVMLGTAWAAGRARSANDYFVAGGRIPWWAAGLSIYATMLSSLTYMAIPAKSFATDWTFFLANVPVLLLAPLVAAVHVPFFRKLGISSAYEYLERRFSRSLRLFGSVSFLALQAGKTAIVLYLPALALSAVSDFDLRLGVLAMGALSLLMTFRGGIASAIWTDVAQSAILLAGAATALVVAATSVPGGLDGVRAIAAADGKGFASLSWGADLTVATGWVILVGNLFSNLVPYTASQDIVQRYLASADDRQAARSVWANALLILPSTALFFAVGTALYAFYKSQPGRLDPQLPVDAVFAQFMVRELPAGLGGLVVAGLFAAAQPTAGLNSMATAWVTDFHPGLPEERRLSAGRRSTAVAATVCTALALLMTVLDVASAWDAFLGWLGLAGGILAGLFALGMFTRRANAAGAWVGVAAAAAALAVVRLHLGWHFFTFGAVGSVVCFAVGWLASRAMGRRP